MSRLQICLLLLLIVSTIFTAGCFGRKKVIFDRPTLPPPERYETVWVDPQIEYTDSLVTLMRATRLDSVLVGPKERGKGSAAAVSFVVSMRECPVSIVLLDWRQEVVRPVFVRMLGIGNYRLSLNSSLTSLALTPELAYYLRADVCGEQVSATFVAD